MFVKGCVDVKKSVYMIFVLFLFVNIFPFTVSARDIVDWKSLYEAKITEITNEYETGIRDRSNIYEGITRFYFSVQDLNFDGVPELYHALCGMFELEPSVSGNEEIYYIKDGAVLKGTIDPSADFCFLPMYAGRKAEPGDVYENRWQFAMKNIETEEVCFITNDSYSGFMDCPERTYSRISFDSTTGVLKTEVLLHQDIESYTVPLYLQGYDYVGADCYNTISEGEWGIYNWKPCYLAPCVAVNGNAIDFADTAPQIINNRTMVPLRAIFEALGANVEWDGATKTVMAVKDDITIKMTIGADSFTRNGEKVALDAPSTIIGSRTLVPVRAIAESFGSTVGWIAESKTVTIED